MRIALLAAAALAACASDPDTGGASREVLVPPASSAFVPFRCGGSLASDPLGDVSGAGQHRDAVGAASRAAALRASDDTFLYLRIRLDDDPRQAADDLRPFGWGFLIDTDDDTTTYGEFIREGRFPESFTRLYAVPLVACVWSSGSGEAMGYPARYLFRFLEHHGMLTVGDSPQWMTVVGGSRTYVDALAERLPAVRAGDPVTSVLRTFDGVEVRTRAGRTDTFDRIVLALHADDALGLLADPTPSEKEVLGAFRYTQNETVLHRDGSLMPRARLARSSWNYLVGADPSQGAVVTYWMNRLQGLPADEPFYVTLNATDRIDPASVVATMQYRHPLYDLDAVRAQRHLSELTTRTTTFAGAYHGWGFHEDGCRSGVEAAAAFGVAW